MFLLLVFVVCVGYLLLLTGCFPWRTSTGAGIFDGNSSATIQSAINNDDVAWKANRQIAMWDPSNTKLDCQRVFRGDNAYARQVKFRIQADPPSKEEDGSERRPSSAAFPMDCASIRARSAFPSDEDEGQQLEWRDEEKHFPLAFARIVYKDYRFLEAELATHYAPQNWYCYTLDSKSTALFRSRMRQLAGCFPNVFVTEREFNITSAGHNTSNAMVECAWELARPEREWHYLVTLQNHDIQAKTNAQLVRTFKALRGANDIEFGNMQGPYIQQRMAYYLWHFNWTFDALALFRNVLPSPMPPPSSLTSSTVDINAEWNNDNNNDDVGDGSKMILQQQQKRQHPTQRNANNGTLQLAKGYASASLSRPFVDFLVHRLDLRTLLAQLNAAPFGVDEHLWQSLCATRALRAPGCCDGMASSNERNEKTKKREFVTRFALWQDDSPGAIGAMRCRSKMWRHRVCVFGLEDLAGGTLFELPHLFLNKMLPDHDHAAIVCWHERMRAEQQRHWMMAQRKPNAVQQQQQLSSPAQYNSN